MHWKESERLSQLLNGSVHHPEFMHIGILLEQSSSMARLETNVGHIKDKLHEHGERLASLETNGAETRNGGSRLSQTLRELVPFLWGLVILAMGATGALDWKLAASLVRF